MMPIREQIIDLLSKMTKLSKLMAIRLRIKRSTSFPILRLMDSHGVTEDNSFSSHMLSTTLSYSKKNHQRK